jgi:hypothetical protein
MSLNVFSVQLKTVSSKITSLPFICEDLLRTFNPLQFRRSRIETTPIQGSLTTKRFEVSNSEDGVVIAEVVFWPFVVTWLV